MEAYQAYLHCLLCALGYVLACYVLVAADVRKLPRDHLQHVSHTPTLPISSYALYMPMTSPSSLEDRSKRGFVRYHA